MKGLPKGSQLYVTYRLRENKEKQQETVFVAVESISKNIVVGKIANQLTTVRTYKTGQWVKFSETDLLDWTIARPDGIEEGNFVGKFLDTYKP